MVSRFSYRMRVRAHGVQHRYFIEAHDVVQEDVNLLDTIIGGELGGSH